MPFYGTEALTTVLAISKNRLIAESFQDIDQNYLFKIGSRS